MGASIVFIRGGWVLGVGSLDSIRLGLNDGLTTWEQGSSTLGQTVSHLDHGNNDTHERESVCVCLKN